MNRAVLRCAFGVDALKLSVAQREGPRCCLECGSGLGLRDERLVKEIGDFVCEVLWVPIFLAETVAILDAMLGILEYLNMSLAPLIEIVQPLSLALNDLALRGELVKSDQQFLSLLVVSHVEVLQLTLIAIAVLLALALLLDDLINGLLKFKCGIIHGLILGRHWLPDQELRERVDLLLVRADVLGILLVHLDVEIHQLHVVGELGLDLFPLELRGEEPLVKAVGVFPFQDHLAALVGRLGLKHGLVAPYFVLLLADRIKAQNAEVLLSLLGCG